MPIAVLTTTHHRYKETLLRIEQNDNTCKELTIAEGAYTRDGRQEFNSRDDFARLGTNIGTNTHLINLVVDPSELDVTHREFFDGLTRNSSIKKVYLHGSRSMNDAGVAHEILKSYQTNSNNLVNLCLHNINLQNEGGHVLAATIQSCTNLNLLSLTNSDIRIISNSYIYWLMQLGGIIL